MTQLQSVQAWSDDELNKAVASEVMGYTVMDDYRDHMNEYAEQIYYDKKSKISKFSPCSDVAPSLEVQAKAIKIDGEGYVDNLIAVLDAGQFYTSDGFDTFGISMLLQATPRQRSEAAYLTIKFKP